MFRSLWQYRHFVLSSIYNDLFAQFARSKLGGLWVIINPLSQVLIYALILSNILSSKLPGIDNKYAYAIYLMAGLLAWNLFSEIIGRCLNLFIAQANIMKKMSFPRITLPTIVVGSCMLNNLLLFISMLGIFAIGVFGMWAPMLSTVTLVTTATLMCLAIGIPMGVWMSKSNRAQSFITPILDIMQTIPSFVYLIPVVMLLGIGKVPGLIAVCIYAMPPIVRLTNLGIRLVDKEALEAADAFGASYKQRLFSVQIPLALPNIFAGVNQTIMMALAMVVIASMIGVAGLGLPVLQAVQNQYLSMGMLNGLAIVVLAIIFDRVSQAYGKRSQRYLGGNES